MVNSYPELWTVDRFEYPNTVEHAYNDHVGTREFDRFIRMTDITV